MTEQDIQSLIRIALSKYGLVFRTNAGKAYSRNGHVINLLPEGFSDLLFCGFDGQVAFIEVKTPVGAVRPAQKQFIEIMKKHGYRAGVARSVEDALNIINQGGNKYVSN